MTEVVDVDDPERLSDLLANAAIEMTGMGQQRRFRVTTGSLMVGPGYLADRAGLYRNVRWRIHEDVNVDFKLVAYPNEASDGYGYVIVVVCEKPAAPRLLEWAGLQ